MTDDVDPDDEAPLVARNIQWFRQARGMTQLQLAMACGTSERTIRRYESGEIDPPRSALRKLAKALGVAKARFHVEREAKPEIPTTAPKPAPSTSSALRQIRELYLGASAPVRAAILRMSRKIAKPPKD